eukprot:6209837-Pleurochrysis_carterae.AAC.1
MGSQPEAQATGSSQIVLVSRRQLGDSKRNTSRYQKLYAYTTVYGGHSSPPRGATRRAFPRFTARAENGVARRFGAELRSGGQVPVTVRGREGAPRVGLLVAFFKLVLSPDCVGHSIYSNLQCRHGGREVDSSPAVLSPSPLFSERGACSRRGSRFRPTRNRAMIRLYTL